MRFFFGLVCLALSASPGLAQVREWTYVGVKYPGTMAEAYVAETSVDDDTLQLLYFPEEGNFVLWFSYNGDVRFSQRLAQEAEFFMRTRDEGSIAGRYESDYVFAGNTIAQPDRDVNVPQLVVATLTDQDIEALRRYEGEGIIGVGYFVEGDLWRTYTLRADGVWAAYNRIRQEAGLEAADAGENQAWVVERNDDIDGTFGWYVDDDMETSLMLRHLSPNTWYMTILVNSDPPDELREINIPIPGGNSVRTLRCGDAYDPDRDIRQCIGGSESTVIGMAFDDADADLLARAEFLMVSASSDTGPGLTFRVSLKGSARTIAALQN